MALPNIFGTPQQLQATKDIANMYWQVPAHIASGLGKATLGLYAGARELEDTWDYSKAKSAFMHMLSKDLGLPMNPATQEAMENIGGILHTADIPFKWAGDMTTKLTGKEYLGDAAYLASQRFGPSGAKFLFDVGTKGFGRTVGPHFPINVRTAGETSLADRGVRMFNRAANPIRNMIADAAAGKKLKGRRTDPESSFYGKEVTDMPLAVGAAGYRTVMSGIRKTLDPRAEVIFKKHGMAPVSITRVKQSLKIIGDEKSTVKQIAFAEKLMIAELRKVYAMNIRSGKPISPELYSVVRDYHPRLMEIKGIPNSRQMNELLGTDIPKPIMDELIRDMAKHTDDAAENVFTLGGNPERSAFQGPPSRKLSPPEESMTAIFAKRGTTYSMIGDLWARSQAGWRFDFGQNKWHKPGTPKHAKLDDLVFDKDTIVRYMDTKEYWATSGVKAKQKAIVSQSKGVNPDFVDVGGVPHLVYHTAQKSDDPLLAGVPAVVVLNPQTGISRIMSYDKFDIWEGMAQKAGESGFQKSFHTVDIGEYIYGDDLLEMAGLGPAVRKTLKGTEKNLDMIDQIEGMIKADTKEVLKQTVKKTWFPAMVAATRQGEDSERELEDQVNPTGYRQW